MEERHETFLYTAEQMRMKFKSCSAACKKAAMTRKNGSGIANFLLQRPDWFKKLFPYVESRESCNPRKAIEPSFEIEREERSDTSNNYDASSW